MDAKCLRAPAELDLASLLQRAEAKAKKAEVKAKRAEKAERVPQPDDDSSVDAEHDTDATSSALSDISDAFDRSPSPEPPSTPSDREPMLAGATHTAPTPSLPVQPALSVSPVGRQGDDCSSSAKKRKRGEDVEVKGLQEGGYTGIGSAAHAAALHESNRQPAASAEGVEKGRVKSRSKARRKVKRMRDAEQASKNGAHSTVKKVTQKHVKRAEPAAADFYLGPDALSQGADSGSLADIPVSSTAFIGRRPDPKEAKANSVPMSKEDALKQGFRYLEWDGIKTIPLVDREDRVFAVLVGRPKSEDWSSTMEEVRAALDDAREQLVGPNEACSMQGDPKKNRRGLFTPLASGISYGGGQKASIMPVPCNNSTTSNKNQAILDGLVHNNAIQRVAGFGSSVFQAYAPRLHGHYESTLSALIERDSRLKRNFPNSAFASMTFNLGPQTVTYRHTDFMNLPAGWCAITAVGDYNPTQGGHIILWELGLVVEFPPGSTILIPSAIIHHSNTTILPHEARYSLTQYSAGGLFRWVECGFMSQKDFDAAGKKHRMDGRECWLQGLGMFSTWSELSGDQADY